jgi:hypothetical protein
MRIVQYTVTPEAAEANADLVRAVYAELDATSPAGIDRYSTVLLEDGVTFIHLFEGDGEALRGVAAFRAFRAGLEDRCAAGPEFHDATVLGAHELVA